jgi:hypothetical protein
MKRWSSFVFLIALTVALIATPLSAQKSTGTISGVVSDPTGAVVPQATVLITNVDTGLTRTVTSNEMGEYIAPDVPNGKYQITVKQAAFKEAVITGVEVHVASTALVNVQLQMGNTSEQVTVEANVIQVQMDSAQLAQLCRVDTASAGRCRGQKLRRCRQGPEGWRRLCRERELDGQQPVPRGRR